LFAYAVIFDVLDFSTKRCIPCALTEALRRKHFFVFFIYSHLKFTIMDIEQLNKTSEELFCDFFNSQKLENDIFVNKTKPARLAIQSTEITAGYYNNKRRLTENLHLKIKLNSTIMPEQQLTATCYNEQWLFMGQADKKSYCLPTYHFDFSSPHIWADGAYFIVLRSDQTPFVKLNFRLDGDNITVCRPESIINDKRYFILTNYIEKSKNRISVYQSLPGMAGIRRKLWDESGLFALNKLRSDFDLDAIDQESHYLLIGPEKGVNAEMAKEILQFLNDRDSFMHKTVTEMIEEKRRKERSNEYYSTGSVICNNSNNYIDNLSALITEEGVNLIYKLEDSLRRKPDKCSLILGGTESEIRQLFELAPGMKAFFPPENHFYIQPFTIEDIVFLIRKELENQSVCMDSAAIEKLYGFLKSEAKYGRLKSWDTPKIKLFVRERFITSLQNKALKCITKTGDFKKEFLTAISSEDLLLPDTGVECNNFFAEGMRQIDCLIGLGNIKQCIKESFNLLYFNDIRNRMGLTSQQTMSHHMIFTGNPGTGKTTVAKLIGKIYHSLGILSKGEVIVTERSKIVGQYIGETEKNMLDILNKAQGNVLFIDEAYSLCNGADGRRDFGQRAIEALLTVLSLDNPGMLIIFAGYKKEMDIMMESNIGLAGRFPHKFHFADYSVEELLLIGDKLIENGKYVFATEARSLWENFVNDSYLRKDRYFSNARWINQMVNHGIITVMAQRVMQHPEFSDEMFFRTIEKEDVLMLVDKTNQLNSMRNIRPVVGFRV
jgi:SpoVK/Ycf46/Vps4 family AAA+-type ATPase